METLYGNILGDTFYVDEEMLEYWEDKTGAPMSLEAADARFRSGAMTNADLADFTYSVALAHECGFFMDIYIELGDAEAFLGMSEDAVLARLDLEERKTWSGYDPNDDDAQFRYYICQWGAYRMLIGGYDC